MKDISGIKNYIGKPYKPGGCDENGFYCWGFVKFLFLRERGIKISDVGDEFPKSVPIERKKDIVDLFQDQWERVVKPQPWDVVVMNLCGKIHVGVVVNKRKFVHCTRAGVVGGGLFDKEWKPNIVDFYRYRT